MKVILDLEERTIADYNIYMEGLWIYVMVKSIKGLYPVFHVG
jgi:hypothetical protein